MECPIKNHAFETSPYKGKSATRECAEAKCAWWNIEQTCCAILLMAADVLIDRGSFAKYAEED